MEYHAVIAAIYARKSTDQNVSDEEKSITRQVEHARAYAARKGWTVADEHVYTDDGISGAEFVKRPGFLRLMASLKPRALFGVLIMSEESRLGREQIETAYALKQIMDAGARVFFYLEDRERTLEGALDKVMLSLTSFAAEMEREKAALRSRDTMQRKAARGHVTGGKVYGYRNREVVAVAPDGQQIRDHVEREIVAAEADVVRRIFREAAGGRGYARIAKALNAEAVPSPARGRGWATTGVREILFRELYRGRMIWGRTRRGTRGGTGIQQDRPESDWLVRESPELRIITDEAWRAAHARLEATRAVYRSGPRGALWGRPAAIAGGHGSTFLLSGLLLCGECGWGLHAMHRTSRRGQPRRYYVCTAHRTRGNTVCVNRQSAPMDDLHQTVLAALKRDVLSPDLVRDVVRRAIELQTAKPAAAAERRKALQAERERLEAELRRYAEAVGAGDPFPAILEAMRGRERRRQEIERELASLAERPAPVTKASVYQELSRRLTDWQGLLERHPAESQRDVLRKLLVGRLIVTPTMIAGERCFEFSGEASYGALLEGLVGGVNDMVAPG